MYKADNKASKQGQGQSSGDVAVRHYSSQFETAETVWISSTLTFEQYCADAVENEGADYDCEELPEEGDEKCI